MEKYQGLMPKRERFPTGVVPSAPSAMPLSLPERTLLSEEEER